MTVGARAASASRRAGANAAGSSTLVPRQLMARADGPALSQRALRPALNYLAAPDELSQLGVGEAVVSVRHRESRLAVVHVTPLHG